jgi:tryptophan synthase alpha chain
MFVWFADALPQMLSQLRKLTSLPLAVGFGISKPEHVANIASLGANAVVVGSSIISALDQLGENPDAEKCTQKVVYFLS